MDNVLTFVQGDFPVVFLLGFASGLIISSLSMGIRAVVNLFARIVSGRV